MIFRVIVICDTFSEYKVSYKFCPVQIFLDYSSRSSLIEWSAFLLYKSMLIVSIIQTFIFYGVFFLSRLKYSLEALRTLPLRVITAIMVGIVIRA